MWTAAAWLCSLSILSCACTPRASMPAGSNVMFARAPALRRAPPTVHTYVGLACRLMLGETHIFASAWAWRGCFRWCAFGWGAPRSPLLRSGTEGSHAPRGSACAVTRALSGTSFTSCLRVRPVFACPATRAACAPFAHLCTCTMLAFSRHPDTLAAARCILACLDEVNLITTRPVGLRP